MALLRTVSHRHSVPSHSLFFSFEMAYLAFASTVGKCKFHSLRKCCIPTALNRSLSTPKIFDANAAIEVAVAALSCSTREARHHSSAHWKSRDLTPTLTLKEAPVSCEPCVILRLALIRSPSGGRGTLQVEDLKERRSQARAQRELQES